VSWRLLFLIFILLNLGDFISTKLVLDFVGTGAEVNPIARWLIITVGIYVLLPVKAVACWAIWNWKHRVTPTVLLVSNVIFTFVVAGNFYNYYSWSQV